ncbi:MAG: hypothetical protein AAGL29_06825 [Bacteroidota bacterium]
MRPQASGIQKERLFYYQTQDVMNTEKQILKAEALDKKIMDTMFWNHAFITACMVIALTSAVTGYILF